LVYGALALAPAELRQSLRLIRRPEANAVD
jgi:hypothetical protein